MEIEDINIGSIIEFDAGDDHRLAIVTDTIGAKKLAILTADGDEMRTTPSEITFEVGSGSTDNPSWARDKLQKLQDTVDNRQSDVELEMLWEFVREDGEPMTAEALSELMFADDAPPTVLAIRRALRADPTYFKHRRDDLYEPRSDGQVASLRRQREARLEKERQHERVIKKIASSLALPEDERPAHIDEAMGKDDALRDAVYLLQDFAAHGEHFSRRDDATEILDDLLERIDQHLDGHMDQKAFFLMVELGLWEEHKNLSLHRYRITPEFGDELMEEAKRIADEPWEPEEKRRDLTQWTAITIDAPSSRDLDDALSCRPTIDGGWELAIHIADPSAHIPQGSALDMEARKRATSIYLPTGNIPMFPRCLSEGKMSLLPQIQRAAMTTRVVIDENLDIQETEIFPSVIEVDRRLSYEEVDRWLSGDDSDDARFTGLVDRLAYIADECHNRRTEDAGAYFDLPDLKINVDEETDPPAVEVDAVDTDTPSRLLVSELMILNNELVGQFCARHQIPAIYRIQEPPDEPLMDDEIRAIPEGIARTFAQIRRMKPGDITSQPGHHFGLGLHTYAQASSPIRRYSDLACQRQLKAHLADEELCYDEESILKVLADVDEAASDASTTQRATQRYWLYYYLSDVDEVLDAVVVDHYDDRGSRASVFLNDCAYRSKCSLRTKVPVGHSVRVVVGRADARRDILSLRQAPEASGDE